ncbi:MAG: ABC transporter permease [Bacilli bacterium]|nr:ABC transporter permease [Bacilli bacterium]
MIVFKTYLKIINKRKWPIILYTVLLIVFGSITISTSDDNINFVASKPDVLIVNNDDSALTRSLVNYLEENTNIIDTVKLDNVDDALFYREVNYVIYIPSDFETAFMNDDNPSITVKGSGDYYASFGEIILNRYLTVANTYLRLGYDKEDIISNTESVLSNKVDVSLINETDTTTLAKVTYYYNFTNYSILAGLIYAISIVMFSFNKKMICYRTEISSLNKTKYNSYLLLSNGAFALLLWFFYVLLSFIMLGSVMFSISGLLYMINSFFFVFFALTLALLLGKLKLDKNAVGGIINVIALGSSFLCGAFVPAAYLPDMVLKIAHVLPSYYFINNNELIKDIVTFDFGSLLPFVINILIMIGFSVIVILLTNGIGKKNVNTNE